ncbi:MAG TPA: alanine racemase [Pseudonocardia sp.]|nr:alanine racemase [Pseudonocardia sp.]
MRDTPYLVVDLALLDRNLSGMAESARVGGMSLRPHAKTHKCVEIARRQVALSGGGLTLATVAEAEVFADAGLDDVFLAYPVVAVGRRARRLRVLAERVTLRVGIDSAEGAALLATAVPGLEVLVEIDSGHHRSGVAPDRAVEVGSAARAAGLQMAGVFTFPGHSYAPGQRGQAAADEAAALAAAADALRTVGIEPRVRSGGSTPTAALSDGDVLTELRPGVYAFQDAQQAELGSADLTDIALTAMATVVSRSGDRAVVDAGSKVLGADRPAWTTGFGRLPDVPDARVVALSEHHATVTFPGPAPAVGERIRIAPNHVCTAVNLADELVVVEGGVEVDRWRVAARGANT